MIDAVCCAATAILSSCRPESRDPSPFRTSLSIAERRIHFSGPGLGRAHIVQSILPELDLAAKTAGQWLIRTLEHRHPGFQVGPVSLHRVLRSPRRRSSGPRALQASCSPHAMSRQGPGHASLCATQLNIMTSLFESVEIMEGTGGSVL